MHHYVFLNCNIFQNDVMIGTISLTIPVLSEISLAVLEDSGFVFK